jgi:hypothetical protein
MFGSKLGDMNSFNNIEYNTVKKKNKFIENLAEDHADATDILISDYSFLPSLDWTISEKIPTILESNYADVYEFSDDNEKSHFNIENLNKYVKFYIKILRRGSEVENELHRSDLV